MHQRTDPVLLHSGDLYITIAGSVVCVHHVSPTNAWLFLGDNGAIYNRAGFVLGDDPRVPGILNEDDIATDALRPPPGFTITTEVELAVHRRLFEEVADAAISAMPIEDPLTEEALRRIVDAYVREHPEAARFGRYIASSYDRLIDS